MEIKRKKEILLEKVVTSPRIIGSTAIPGTKASGVCQQLPESAERIGQKRALGLKMLDV
jgi:hypothetical protein